jgi:predicted phosphoribosyltransferase
VSPARLHERPELRDRARVFRDRAHAGEVLAEMLEALRGSAARILAIPAGGVPVAERIARALDLPLDVAVVSKMTPPWNSEVGYGAVASDGSVRLNHRLVLELGLTPGEVERGVAATLEKVRRRARSLRGSDAPPELSGALAVVVDDGIASGFTMLAAVEALRKAGAERAWVAVPTASLRAVLSLAGEVQQLYCANVRGGASFAVADAYERWSDVDEAEAARILARAAARR